MTFLQSKIVGLHVLHKWNHTLFVWQVKFRLASGEDNVRFFRRRYRAEEFAAMLLGATVTEVPPESGPVVE